MKLFREAYHRPPHIYVNVEAIKRQNKRLKKERRKKAVKEFFFGVPKKSYTYKMSAAEKNKWLRQYKKKYVKKPPKLNLKPWDIDYSVSRKVWDYEYEEKKQSDFWNYEKSASASSWDSWYNEKRKDF